MKQKHLYSLLDNSATTVKVRFLMPTGPQEWRGEGRVQRYDNGNGAPIHAPSPNETLYTYKAPLAMGLRVDDLVIVHSESRGWAFARVMVVDETADIDVDADSNYHWIVQRVDREGYQALIDKEKMFGTQMLKVERARQRESLLDSFRASLPEGSAARALFDNTAAGLAKPVFQTPPMQPRDVVMDGEGNATAV